MAQIRLKCLPHDARPEISRALVPRSFLNHSYSCIRLALLQSYSLLFINSFSGNKVTANVNTLYPFGDTLTTTVTATSAFTYYVRIPSWVSGGTIAINGGKATAVSPSNGLQAVSIPAGTTTFVLNLPAQITTGAFR